MSSRTTLLTSLAATLLAGCASANDMAAFNGAEDGVPDTYLRVDVFPSDRNDALMPESHWVDGWWYDSDTLELGMSTPVQLEGLITAVQTVAGPRFDDSGRVVPVGASVAAWIEGSIMAASTTSDEQSGAYQLNLPPQQGWAVAVVPEDGSGIPFCVYTDQDIIHDQPDWDVLLDNGAQVRGTVTDTWGEPVSDLLVRAVHSETGVAGPTVYTRAGGHYSLHLEPDLYTLEIGGDEGEGIPTTTMQIEALDDEVLRMDLELGALEPALASGRVVDGMSNRPVAGVELRFWSRGLVDHPSAALEISATTDQAGAYSVDLLPGEWRVELVALADDELTPMEASFSVETGEETLDLGVTTMQPYVHVQSVVRDPSGEPSAGVTVVVSEQGISDRTFTATTDTAGSFTLALPAGELHLVLTPGDSSAAVTHLDLDLDGDSFPHGLDLALGRLLTGRIVHDNGPVQAALVEVRDGSTERLYATTITDSDGNFEIRLATDADDLPPNDGLDEDTGYWD
jgi:protocatechuate 3,4-dioxygenase beta subunit